MEHAKSSAKLLGKTKHHGRLWKTLVHAVVPHADAGKRGFGFLGWCFSRSEVTRWVYWIWGMLFGSNVVSSIGLGSFKCIEMLLSVGLHWVSLCYTLFVSVQFIVMFDHNVRSIWTRPGTVLTMPVLPMIFAQPTWAEAPLFCFW